MATLVPEMISAQSHYKHFHSGTFGSMAVIRPKRPNPLTLESVGLADKSSRQRKANRRCAISSRSVRVYR